jgi:CubicO group peptidase (beta-lactamase class C family)
MRTRLAQFILLAAAPVASLSGQTPSTQVSQAPQQDLAEFEGHYQYRDGGTLYVVSGGQQLFAIIGETKVLLRVAGTDTFLNPPGNTIPFVRDAGGRVVAFKESGVQFARLSSDVPASARQLLIPRADGPNGLPVVYRYEPPPQLRDGIEVGEAGATGLPPEVAEQLVNGVIDGTYPDVHSLLIYHRGSLVLEEYFYGFDRDRTHEMRSLTKSVISLLAGAAVDRELLSPDEPALDRLGYAGFANPDPGKAKVTLTHLLSSQAGFDCNEHDSGSPGHETKLFETDDWVKAYLDLPMVAQPGTKGSYCSGGFYTAGRIVEVATGKPLPEFADEALFQPLGIDRADWKWNFTLDRSQRNEWGQIHLRPRDMLRLGMLIRDGGKWSNHQVISRSWIEAATSMQSRIDDDDYGLGIWHRWYGIPTAQGQRRIDTIMLSGNGGQKVQIVPSLDLIVVSTGAAFFVNSPINDMLARVLLPTLMSTAPGSGRCGDGQSPRKPDSAAC